MEINESTTSFTLFLKKEKTTPSVSEVREVLDASGYTYEVSYGVDDLGFSVQWGMNITIKGNKDTESEYILFLTRTSSDPTQIGIDNFNNYFYSFSKKAEIDTDSNLIWELGIFTDIKGQPQEKIHALFKFMSLFSQWSDLIRDNNLFQIKDMDFVKSIAKSVTLPSYSHIISIHGVSMEAESKLAWIHTHGLTRCGLPELEMVDIPREVSDYAITFLASVARLIIEEGDVESGEIDYLGLTLYLIPIDIAKKSYNKPLTVTEDDRRDHDTSNVLSIFIEVNSFYFFKRKVPISTVPEIFNDSRLLNYSKKETERMAALARETFEFFASSFTLLQQTPFWDFQVKVGYLIKGESDSSEHLWFRITDLNKLQGELLNEPYWIPELEKGKTYTLKKEDLTDWQIDSFEFETNFTPDNYYLLEKYTKWEVIPKYAFSVFNSVQNWQKFVQNILSFTETFEKDDCVFLYNSGKLVFRSKDTGIDIIPVISQLSEEELITETFVHKQLQKQLTN